MRKISLIVLRAGSAALISMAPVVFGAAPAGAQTMGEYGATVGSSSTGTIGMSSEGMAPPAAVENPVGGGSSTSTVEVSNSQPREDDSANHRDDDSSEANQGDEWSQSQSR